MKIKDIKIGMFVRFIDEGKTRYYGCPKDKRYRVRKIFVNGDVRLEAFSETDGSPIDVGYCGVGELEEIPGSMGDKKNTMEFVKQTRTITKEWHVRLTNSCFTVPEGSQIGIEQYDPDNHNYLVRFGSGDIDWFHQLVVEDHCDEWISDSGTDTAELQHLCDKDFDDFIHEGAMDLFDSWSNAALNGRIGSLDVKDIDNLKHLLRGFFSAKK